MRYLIEIDQFALYLFLPYLKRTSPLLVGSACQSPQHRARKEYDPLCFIKSGGVLKLTMLGSTANKEITDYLPDTPIWIHFSIRIVIKISIAFFV